MAADLHIHIASAITNPDKWYYRWRGMYRFGRIDPIDYMLDRTPNQWVGSVSWYSEKYIPPAVKVIDELFNSGQKVHRLRLRKIDNYVIGVVSEAMLLPNHTQFRLEDRAKVLKFLGKHKGKSAFVISW